jgi:hypothetical protein
LRTALYIILTIQLHFKILPKASKLINLEDQGLLEVEQLSVISRKKMMMRLNLLDKAQKSFPNLKCNKVNLMLIIISNKVGKKVEDQSR